MKMSTLYCTGLPVDRVVLIFSGKSKILTCFLLFIYDFLLCMRDTEREAETQGRGKSRLPAGSPMWDWIPEPRNHHSRQTEPKADTHSTAEPSRDPRFKLI